MKPVIAFLLFATALRAQDATVSLVRTQWNIWEVRMEGSAASALEWRAALPPFAMFTLSGNALEAGATLTCAGESGFTTCIAATPDGSPLPRGAVALAYVVQVAPWPLLTDAEAAARNGDRLLTLSRPERPEPALTSLSCQSRMLRYGSSTQCQIQLAEPAKEEVQAQLTATTGALIVPDQVTFAAGKQAAFFTATAVASARRTTRTAALPGRFTARINADLGESGASTVIQLAAPTRP